MEIHIDEKNIQRYDSVKTGFILELTIDQSLLGFLNDAAATGLYGESTAETAIGLIRRQVERLVKDAIIDLPKDSDDG